MHFRKKIVLADNNRRCLSPLKMIVLLPDYFIRGCFFSSQKTIVPYPQQNAIAAKLFSNQGLYTLI